MFSLLPSVNSTKWITNESGKKNTWAGKIKGSMVVSPCIVKKTCDTREHHWRSSTNIRSTEKVDIYQLEVFQRVKPLRERRAWTRKSCWHFPILVAFPVKSVEWLQCKLHKRVNRDKGKRIKRVTSRNFSRREINLLTYTKPIPEERKRKEGARTKRKKDKWWSAPRKQSRQCYLVRERPP